MHWSFCVRGIVHAAKVKQVIIIEFQCHFLYRYLETVVGYQPLSSFHGGGGRIRERSAPNKRKVRGWQCGLC